MTCAVPGKCPKRGSADGGEGKNCVFPHVLVRVPVWQVLSFRKLDKGLPSVPKADQQGAGQAPAAEPATV
jgi:hypothetical protein